MRRPLAGLAATVLAAGLTILAVPAGPAYALDDGLARTPPMGFNNWNSTACRADFNETMVKAIADIFVSSGLEDAGYRYVNIDDCWAEQTRDADGNLVPNHTRFPNGIKPVADYVHSKGLKFGIYTSAGTKTCNGAGGFPGGLGHEQQDANLFASWGVDYLKYDNCNNQNVDAQVRYKAMRDALKATGRPIVYSITEWGRTGPPKVWTWGKDVGHLWRTTGDIGDNYASMLNIVKQNIPLAPFAGPGHWNDPDMLEVGNGGMTDTEYRTHFSLWAVMSAPLLIGTDLRKATPATFSILKNSDVIAVDQDPLGVQATELRLTNGAHVLVKPLANGDKAVALFNESDLPQRITTSAAQLGLPTQTGYAVRDLWAHTAAHTAGTVAATVPAHGTAMFRVSADPGWHTLPPSVDFGAATPAPYPGGTPIAAPGSPVTVTTTVTNAGVLAAVGVVANVAAPAGWQVQAVSPPLKIRLDGFDSAFTTSWAVTAPVGTAPGRYELPATLRWQAPDRSMQSARTSAVVVVPPAPPPAGTTFLSDDQWMTAVSGFGPVERDTSNGERAAGDGHPITIGGVVYAKGIGMHAPGRIEYFTGGRCTEVSADVGVDDEKAANGTVGFEVWADGVKVADSGVTTTTMAAVPVKADVTGAKVVALVVNDGGDGMNSDHADWAGATVTCG